MRIRSVKIENFGPFYKQHDLDLQVNEAAPVILIYGENMRGKTSFLNAIRWCLYGKAYDRRGSAIPTYRFINYDAIEEGDFHMSVTLDYEHDGHRYLLERHIQATYRPNSDKDLVPKLYLRRDGHFVPTEDIPEIVGDMLHEDIARFFLFDGEMLGHYEVLLSESDRDAALVKESIEQILGLPALQMVIEDLESLRRDAERRQLRAVRAAEKNRQLVAEAQQISNEIDTINHDLKQLVELLDSVEAEKDQLTQRLDDFSEIKADVREIEQIEQTIFEKEQQRDGLIEECRQLLSSFWWMPLAGKADELRERLMAQAREETSRMEKLGILRHDIEHLTRAINEAVCPVCEQDIQMTASTHLAEKLATAEAEISDLARDADDLSTTLSSVDKLRPFADSQILIRLHEKEDQVRRLQIEIRRHQRHLESIKERLREHDIPSIRATEERHEWCIVQIENMRKAIEEKKELRNKLQTELSALNQQIQHLPGADPRTAAEIDIYTGLEKTFKGAVERFRAAVRHDVEQEATAIFTKLTTETSYDRLTINDRYGLLIVDADGRNIRDRSAGAEQVVALSLIGALNRCAVREGPVIMDTPFGRLDVRHRENILTFVPTMSPQVILLVQSGEFDRDRDLVHLEKRVGREYRLVRDESPTRSRFETLS